MKKNLKTRFMTLVYLAPILIVLGACMSCSGNGGGGCSGSSTPPNCGTGSHLSSDGQSCCGNGVSC